MSSNDEWLDIVSGRRSADASSADQRQAAAVREYFLKRMEDDNEPLVDEARERRMMNFLEAKGAFREAAAAGRARQSGGFAGLVRSVLEWLDPARPGASIRYGALAAIVAAVAIVPLLQQPPEGVTKSGGSDIRDAEGVYRRAVADPAGAARQLASRLEAAGIPARVVESAGAWRIEAKVGAAQRDAASAALSEIGAPLPANGIVVVELRAGS